MFRVRIRNEQHETTFQGPNRGVIIVNLEILILLTGRSLYTGNLLSFSNKNFQKNANRPAASRPDSRRDPTLRLQIRNHLKSFYTQN